MLDYQKRPPRPWRVQLGLAGLPTRWSAVACLWFTAAVPAAGLVAGFFRPWAWLAVPVVVVAPWYWACIRWVDRNDQWG